MLNLILKIINPINEFIHNKVDKIMSQKSARELQDIQHIFGGFYSLSLILFGIMAGQKDILLSIIFGISTFIIQRFSSEITFQTQIKVIKQYSNGK